MATYDFFIAKSHRPWRLVLVKHTPDDAHGKPRLAEALRRAMHSDPDQLDAVRSVELFWWPPEGPNSHKPNQLVARLILRR